MGVGKTSRGSASHRTLQGSCISSTAYPPPPAPATPSPTKCCFDPQDKGNAWAFPWVYIPQPSNIPPMRLPRPWGQYPQYNISCWSSRSSAVKNVCQYFSSIHYGDEKPTWDINTAEFMVGHFRTMTAEDAFLFTLRHWAIYLTLGLEQELILYAMLMHVLDKLFSFLFILSSGRNAVEQLKVSFHER